MAKMRSRGPIMRRGRPPKRDDEFDQVVVDIARVTRVMAGGKRMRFRACVVVGDKKGRVGFGVAKASDVAMAVSKSSAHAKKHLIRVPMVRESIPHEVRLKYKSASILLKPAPQGTGIIAGGPVRSVIEMSGVKNIVSKMLGSQSKINNVSATIRALKTLKEPAKKEESS